MDEEEQHQEGAEDGAIHEGDFFGAGATIDVDHDIGGDFFAAAGTIDVKSAVWDDVRVAGSQITLDADIGDDLFAVGSVVECSNDSVVGADAMPEIERAEKMIADLKAGRLTPKAALAQMRERSEG